ncbi:hypothetical protein CRYUN_Cryun01aG0043000 [Craigia yunnanensis]
MALPIFVLGENEPRVIFRNIVQRPRHKSTGETVIIVGDQDTALLKYFDCTRSGPRSAFDSIVVFQFEIMEYILDFAFDRLGANGSRIDHPILITECMCNPVQSRSKMAELLFETYGVPSVAFGVDAAFIYKYNQQHGICKKDGLAICPGFTTTHVIPFVDGEPVYKGCYRTNIGGYHVTDNLKQLLSLKYHHHIGGKEAEDKTRCWQLTWVPPPTEEPPSEEEIARKAAIREIQGQRLREMAEAKRSSRINELKNQLQGLEFLWHQFEQIQEGEILSFLSKTGYVSKQEIESTLMKVSQSLRKAKGESNAEQAENEENADFSTTEKEKPELYLEQMRTKYKELYEKIEQRKRLKTNGGHTNGNSLSWGVGRGERLNAAQRERMRLLTTAAFDEGRVRILLVPKMKIGNFTN